MRADPGRPRPRCPRLREPLEQCHLGLASAHAADDQLQQVEAESISRILFFPVVGSVLPLDVRFRRGLRSRNPNGQQRANDRDRRRGRPRGGALLGDFIPLLPFGRAALSARREVPQLHVPDLVGQGRPELVGGEDREGFFRDDQRELALRVRTHAQVDRLDRQDAQRGRAAVCRPTPDA